MPTVRRVVVPVDTAGPSRGALAVAVRGADPFEGRLHRVHVRTWQPLPPRSGEAGSFPALTGELFTETPEQATSVIDAALRTTCSRVVADGIVVETPRSMVAWAIVGAQVLHDTACSVLVMSPRPA